MNFNLTTELHPAFIILCLLLGFIYAFILYRKRYRFEEAKPVFVYVMSILRFLVVSFLAFLLLTPLVKSILSFTEKPVIIIAQDNSESITAGKDSVFYKTVYKEKFDQLVSSLSEAYNVEVFSFGDKINANADFSFNNKQTDISSLFNEIYTRYSNRNVGSVIIASDGLYNKGNNPLYESYKFTAPVYTVALGDTNIHKDIILKKVNHNEITYMGNLFPIEVIVGAHYCNNQNTRIVISKDKDTLVNSPIIINDPFYSNTFSYSLKAKEEGIQRYKVNIVAVKDEISYVNNSFEFFIDVLNGKQKILILSNTPHPDISAIKEAISTNENYEVSEFTIDEFAGQLSKYNLVILHQLPSLNPKSNQIISEINKQLIPVCYVLGSQTNINSFNAANSLLKILEKRSNWNEIQALNSKQFNLFTISDETHSFVPQLPPLSSPYGSYKIAASADILFNQKIGIIDTDQPLWLFGNSTDSKIAVIAGEGIWKWKMYDYATHKNHTIFNELIDKTVQYLSLKVDKSLFRVSCKNRFNENEALVFDAELYNESYELINDEDVNIEILNADDKKFPFNFSKTTSAYRLNAGIFPPGHYRYIAKVNSNGKKIQETGEFSITALQVEQANTIANHQLLYALAHKYGGEMVYPTDIEKLADTLKKREDIKTVSYAQSKLQEIINIKWILALIILFLSIEWFLRKQQGAY